MIKPYYENDDIKLYKGDCLDVMDHLIKNGVKVDAVITDPPYGTTANDWDTIVPFDKMWEKLNQITYDKAPKILFCDTAFSGNLQMSNIKDFKYKWYWKKENATAFLLAEKQPLRIIEEIQVFYKEQSLYNPQYTYGKAYTCKQDKRGSNYGEGKKEHVTVNDGKRYPNNLLTYQRDKEKLHPTQKPIELLKHLIKTYTSEDGIILDFTCGSGSTLVAAKILQRKCIGIEQNKEFCDITVKRLNTEQKIGLFD